MPENDTQFEFTGATVEDAIQDGLDALGLRRDEIDVEIVEEGSKGLFGLGSKEAVVRIRYMPAASASAIPEETFPEDADQEWAEEVPAEATTSGAGSETFDITDEPEEIVSIARATVEELLEKMHVKADVSAQMMPEDSHSRRSAIAVDISGDDLSILIGRKAETLEALEYISRLIVGKEIGNSVILNIDVQGYKKRKEQRLRRIAQSVARQAIDTGRRQYLEPMSPAERRIIHMELRDHPDVYTESTGEGNRRKVTINPKV